MILLAAALLPGVAAAENPPPFRGTGGQFVFMKPAATAPATLLKTLSGEPVSLADLRGQLVLVNFWATWCLPCLREMPALERLATAAPPGLRVVAVSIDERGAAAVGPFAAQQNLSHLTLYLDPERRLGALTARRSYPEVLPLWGLPVSYLIGRDGRVIGYLTGAAEWDSPAARGFLDYFLAPAG